MTLRLSAILALVFICPTLSRAAIAAEAPAAAGKQESTEGITHGFIAFGAETYRVDSEGKVTWTYPANTRDGWVLPGGNVLLAVSKSNDFPGGGAAELKPDGTVVWSYKGTQSEVNTVQSVGDGRYLLTEAGPKPRLLEVNGDGKVLVDVPLRAQTHDFHLQTRMSRKLANGNYLVPQLLDRVVREYTPEGKIVWEAKTPDAPAEAWPFTAIRLPDGNTLVTCTHSKMVVEFDKDAKIVWRLTNFDLPKPMLADPCGAQRLPNGNTVITSYGQATPGEVKLLEVTREKKVVWTYRDEKKHGIHEFQITETNGKALEGSPLR